MVPLAILKHVTFLPLSPLLVVRVHLILTFELQGAFFKPYNLVIFCLSWVHYYITISIIITALRY